MGLLSRTKKTDAGHAFKSTLALPSPDAIAALIPPGSDRRLAVRIKAITDGRLVLLQPISGESVAVEPSGVLLEYASGKGVASVSGNLLLQSGDELTFEPDGTTFRLLQRRQFNRLRARCDVQISLAVHDDD